MDPILQVEDLHVSFSTRRGVVAAVRGVDFRLYPGQTLGIVGESGSGKSVTAYAVTHLLDAAGKITGGHILFAGQDITRAGERDLRGLRGAAISMVFQNPRAALHPIRTIGTQISDALLSHRALSIQAARAEALELLRTVRIRDPETRLDCYPHELSGGMCQRVMIAMAIACDPTVLIADEPTTGLDVTTQKTVMDLIAGIAAERGMGVVLITHDLGLAARYCQEIVVMEQGVIVECAAPQRLFFAPEHPYTRRLVAASPTQHSRIEDLTIDGEAPLPPERVRPRPQPGEPKLLEVRNLMKSFGGQSPAVAGVSLTIAAGESLGLVGESGSGKSTLSRMISRLLDQTEGEIIFNGELISSVSARDANSAWFRSQIQIVFQDANESINPRYSAFDAIAHPLRRLTDLDRSAIEARVTECAEKVGLPLNLLARFPHQLSGGQKARIGIARAIAARPRLLILDEPTAALDVSVQAITLQLLERLRREDDLAFLFVSHDLNVVRMMCERAIVMRNGQVEEEGTCAELFEAPKADYTRRLLDAIPHLRNEIAPPLGS